ncbi:hypothetical protein BFP76_07325 [Amylibacter kogurei]|uniref:Host specificity protein n=1 Tax=Paramylibacter kogurei TaxID=1889778 RepID=A0A2G5K5Y2_9RHOB|nr:glycoside hydrolase/phage tail family protein [Amylibacter kogurei]PIB24956.1 hypothetical protein BFP76_07325 [Amylibacter kogurei]
MATIVLAAAGAAVGGAVGGTFLGVGAAAIGQAIGASIGGVIDQAVFGQGAPVVEHGRVDKFRVQSTTEGAIIPRIMGRSRIAGQMIWSSNFMEHKETQSAGKGTGGAKVDSYSYSVSFAMALGEGVVSKIGRIWADGQEISRQDIQMTLYSGTSDQLPDPVIAAVEGIDQTPAFRGTAYVVFENLPLGTYGNRIPQLNFEVFRNAQISGETSHGAAHTVNGVCLIPGTGEYALATEQVHFPGEFGDHSGANVNTARGGADFIHAVDDLVADAPNCKSVSLVVSWFGNDLRCNHCDIRPMVEQNEVDGKPQKWRAGGLSRADASVIPKVDGRSIFGGTPSDESVMQAIEHLRNMDQEVMFYPFILMDILDGNTLPNPWDDDVGQPIMPWRGRITSSTAPRRDNSPDQTETATNEVAVFFGTVQVSDFTISAGNVIYSGPAEWSYRRFILHYASLCAAAGGVDAFCIGSEMRALTQLRGAGNTFPAVDQLIELAQDVRAILGPETKISYAADWSEYFGYHPQDGSGDVFFHLDPLWASADIDFIGIDNYMPLSDWRDGSDHLDAGANSAYDQDYLQSNIEGGEGYDWYYATPLDRETQTRTPISDGAYAQPWVFRYKDMQSWWSRKHYNRIGDIRAAQETAWVPASKPIWFTEYGCPAIDKGCNQPNVFVDPKSSESAKPYFSNGDSDELIQRAYLKATHDYWRNPKNNPISDSYHGHMIDMDHAHVWAWDARPWPEFPARGDVWSDGGNYMFGHWVSGRLFGQDLADVVREICENAGFRDYDVSKLFGNVIGYAIEQGQTARESLQPLMQAFEFGASEVNGKIVFEHLSSHPKTNITDQHMALDIEGQEQFSKTRAADETLAGRMRLAFYNPEDHYQSGEVEVALPDGDKTQISRHELPLTMRKNHAKSLLRKWMKTSQISKDQMSFALPMSQLGLTGGDVIEINGDDKSALYRIDQIEEQGARIVNAVRIEPARNSTLEPQQAISPPRDIAPNLPIYAKVLDIPNLSSDDNPLLPYVGATANPWGQADVYISAENDGFEQTNKLLSAAVFGKTKEPFAAAIPSLWSRTVLHIDVSQNDLQSASELSVLNGKNAFAIKDSASADWEIVQFQIADLQPDGSYVLSGFLRGQLGTEHLIPEEWPTGADIVFLNTGVSQVQIPHNLSGLDVNLRIGPASKLHTDDAYEQSVFTPKLNGLRPYAPVHLQCENLANGDKNFHWVRRTRIGGDNWQSVDVPLGEIREEYQVQIIGAGTVLRSEIVTNSGWNYTANAQANDGVTGEIEFSVCQISETYGPGPQTRMTVNV